ncbi:MBL fold metallo-hydrolase [Alteribacter lacisalsi]|nr:MBL fold metallo-hydrolase [Alteribacter lacisalsi]
MKVTFLGGAGEYGRSSFLLEYSQGTVMVDCGVMKKDVPMKEKYPLLRQRDARKIDAVFVTHSHEDHTLALPWLSRLGYRGPVFATGQTIKQTKRYISSWRKNQRNIPYSPADERRLAFVKLPDYRTNEWLRFNDHLTFKYGRSGHTAGSVWFAFHADSQTVFFSGDCSLESTLLSYEWPKIQQVDLAVMDGAYGDFDADQAELLGEAAAAVAVAASSGEQVLFQVPSVGKSQELLAACAKQHIPLYADSGVSKGCEELAESPDWLNGEDTRTFFRRIARPGSPVTKVQKPSDVQPGSAGFFTAETLLAHKERLTGKNVHLFSAGPEDEELKNFACQASIPYTKFKLKVHPGLRENQRLVSMLRPVRTVFTHGTPENVQRLIGKMPGCSEYVACSCGDTVDVKADLGEKQALRGKSK